MARATASWSNAARSALEPPPRTTTMMSTGSVWSLAIAEATLAGASLPCTGVGATVTSKARPDTAQATQEIVVPLRAGAGHQAHPEGNHRKPQAALAVVEVLVHQGLDQPGPFGGHAAEQRLGVDLPHGEIDRAAGLVEADIAPHPHHHAGLEGDADTVESESDRPPGARPALGAERGSAGIAGLSRIDQVDEAVAPGEDLHGPHLARDPDLLGEGVAHRPVDTVVELGDGKGVRSAVLRDQLPGTGLERHGFRIEPGWVTSAGSPRDQGGDRFAGPTTGPTTPTRNYWPASRIRVVERPSRRDTSTTWPPQPCTSAAPTTDPTS